MSEVEPIRPFRVARGLQNATKNHIVQLGLDEEITEAVNKQGVTISMPKSIWGVDLIHAAEIARLQTLGSGTSRDSVKHALQVVKDSRRTNMQKPHGPIRIQSILEVLPVKGSDCGENVPDYMVGIRVAPSDSRALCRERDIAVSCLSFTLEEAAQERKLQVAGLISWSLRAQYAPYLTFGSIEGLPSEKSARTEVISGIDEGLADIIVPLPPVSLYDVHTSTRGTRRE